MSRRVVVTGVTPKGYRRLAWTSLSQGKLRECLKYLRRSRRA